MVGHEDYCNSVAMASLIQGVQPEARPALRKTSPTQCIRDHPKESHIAAVSESL